MKKMLEKICNILDEILKYTPLISGALKKVKLALIFLKLTRIILGYFI